MPKSVRLTVGHLTATQSHNMPKYKHPSAIYPPSQHPPAPVWCVWATLCWRWSESLIAHSSDIRTKVAINWPQDMSPVLWPLALPLQRATTLQGHRGHLCHCGVNHSSTGYNIVVKIAWEHHKQNSSGAIFHLRLWWRGQFCSNTPFSYRSALSACLFWDLHTPFVHPWNTVTRPSGLLSPPKILPKTVVSGGIGGCSEMCAHLSAHVWIVQHRHSLFFS